MRAPQDRARHRRGFTLIELVVAMGLVSIVMLAVYRLLDSAMGLWTRGEVQRSLVEASSATGGLLASDLRSLHPGLQGDLVAEWVAFDSDGDGIRERYWPRMRLVRHASPSTVARLMARSAPLPEANPEPEPEEGAPEARGDATALGARTLNMPGSRLMEVVWCIVPASARAKDKDLHAEGLLLRGERLLDDGTTGSVFAPSYFDGGGLPPVGETEVVTGGFLFCGMSFAAQTTLFTDGWKIGPGTSDAAGSWDAWQNQRPDPDIHEWNEPSAGAPPARGTPVLPRRVRIELEFERPVDRMRRARTVSEIDATETSFQVTTGERLPEVGGYLLVGAEWMQVASKDRDRVGVRRAVRGTAAVIHPPGELVHYGETVVFEVPISVYRDDWNYAR